jgi:hypothetical protein
MDSSKVPAVPVRCQNKNCARLHPVTKGDVPKAALESLLAHPRYKIAPSRRQELEKLLANL